MTTHIDLPADARYELLFQSLYQSGRALAFPCDAQGNVALDTLSDKVRQNYFDALAAVGRAYAMPVVRLRNHH